MTVCWLPLQYLIVLMMTSSCYLSSQAWSQMQLMGKRRPVDEVIADQATSPATKAKLALTKQVLAFAKAQDLVVEDSYQKFVSLDGPAVTYLVQAAKPEEFKLKTWWFPIVGTVPYLGFFQLRERDDYAAELEASGLEVHRGAAVAFSSLGWFSDPIYSSMLREDDLDLAHLYFHELTHKTAWVKGSVEFNENLAEFVGDQLTERFFTEQGRKAELAQKRIRDRDREKFKKWLAALRLRLERYFVDSKDKSVEDLVNGKKQIILEAVSSKPKFEEADFVGDKPWNTPRILGASLYSPNTALFAEAYRCAGTVSLGNFAREIKKILEKADDPDEGLRSICANKTTASTPHR